MYSTWLFLTPSLEFLFHQYVSFGWLYFPYLCASFINLEEVGPVTVVTRRLGTQMLTVAFTNQHRLVLCGNIYQILILWMTIAVNDTQMTTNKKKLKSTKKKRKRNDLIVLMDINKNNLSSMECLHFTITAPGIKNRSVSLWCGLPWWKPLTLIQNKSTYLNSSDWPSLSAKFIGVVDSVCMAG